MLNITAGTDITLAVTLRRDGKLFPVELSEGVKVNMVSQRGVRTSVSCRVGTGKVAIPLLGDDFAVGVYGVEITGVLNGGKWRTFGSSVVKYTYATERGAARVVTDGDTYDIELEVGAMSDIVPHSLSELDSDPGHRTVTDEEKERWNQGGGSIDIVKVDGEPLEIDPEDKSVDIDLSGKQDTISDLDEIRDGAALGATAIQEHQDISGKVDKVGGKGLSTNDYTTEEKNKLAGLENYNDTSVRGLIAAETQRAQRVEQQLKEGTISAVSVSVDNNTGTPSGSASVSGSTLSLSFQNLKGNKGDTGATGPKGPQGERGLPGESGVTGDVSGFTVHQTIAPSATYGATDIAGAASLQATNQELTELAGEVDDYSHVNVKPLICEFSVLSRKRSADTLTWGVQSGLNMIRADIPSGTEYVRIKMSNPAFTTSGGYLAYYFSTSAPNGNENIINENYLGIPSGVACDVDNIVPVPTNANFIYLCSTQTGTVGSITTSAEVYVVHEITEYTEKNRELINNHETKLRDMSYLAMPMKICNLNRVWRSDTHVWASAGGLMNVASLAIPTGTKKIYLSLKNPPVALTYAGYVAFWFSESPNANDAYITYAGEVTVGACMTCGIEQYLDVPVTAKYLYVATTQGSAVGDIVSTNILAMVDKQESQEPQEPVYILAEKRLPLLTKVGYYVSSVDGSLVSNSVGQYAILDLNGKGYKKIRLMMGKFGGNLGYGFFLADNTWVGTRGTTGTQNTYIEVDVPNNAVEFRASWSLDYVKKANWFYVTYLEEEKAYIDSQKDTRKAYPFQFNYALSVIDAPVILNYNSNSLDDFYALYDGLVSSYPNYVSKIDCSDADGQIAASHPSYLTESLPIYLYKFCPTPKANNFNDGNEFLNIMIVTGLHSNEKLGMFTIYYLMKKICEDWKENIELSQLRKLVNFYIIPCLNPWGYVNAGSAVGTIALPGRQNGNGVNLNRNFPTENWYQSGSASDGNGNYSGATAGSEYETQICMYYANLFNIDIFHDAHTGNMNAYGAFGVIECYDGGDMQNMAMVTSRQTTTDMIKLDSNFPDNGDQRLIDVNVVGTMGEAHRWAWENITKNSWLSEQSIESKFRNGTLTNSVVESATSSALIWQMNMRAMYNLLLHQIQRALKN